MKKRVVFLASIALALSACATNDPTGAAAASTTQQLGGVALKIAINAKCTTELNNLPAWKTATKVMTADQKTMYKVKFVVVSVKRHHKVSAL